MIEGLRRIPLRRFEDERGWFVELNRASWHEKPMRQTNISFSRAGVIRGLHFHERGQDDLFVCVQGTARVVVLDLESAEAFTEDIGDENPVAIYVPGRCAHGFEALTDLMFCYHVTEEYDPADPDEHEVPWNDPRVVDLWSTRSPILSVRDQAASCSPAPAGSSAPRSPRSFRTPSRSRARTGTSRVLQPTWYQSVPWCSTPLPGPTWTERSPTGTRPRA